MLHQWATLGEFDFVNWSRPGSDDGGEGLDRARCPWVDAVETLRRSRSRTSCARSTERSTPTRPRPQAARCRPPARGSRAACGRAALAVQKGEHERRHGLPLDSLLHRRCERQLDERLDVVEALVGRGQRRPPGSAQCASAIRAASPAESTRAETGGRRVRRRRGQLVPLRQPSTGTPSVFEELRLRLKC